MQSPSSRSGNGTRSSMRGTPPIKHTTTDSTWNKIYRTTVGNKHMLPARRSNVKICLVQIFQTQNKTTTTKNWQ